MTISGLRSHIIKFYVPPTPLVPQRHHSKSLQIRVLKLSKPPNNDILLILSIFHQHNFYFESTHKPNEGQKDEKTCGDCVSTLRMNGKHQRSRSVTAHNVVEVYFWFRMKFFLGWRKFIGTISINRWKGKKFDEKIIKFR